MPDTKYTALIIDHDKLPKDIWDKLWKDGVILYAAVLPEGSYGQVTQAIDDIQEKGAAEGKL